MARKRMIDPSLWTDEGMAELTPRQQLLYIGLFSNADDDGRLKGSAVAVSLMLPTVYAGVQRDEIDRDIDALCSSMRQLSRYDYDGRQFLVFANFRKWQRIDKPSPSVLPEPTTDATHSPTTPKPFDDSSASDTIGVPPNRIEEKLREEKESIGDKSPKPTRKPSGAAQEIVAAWCSDVGVEQPASYPKAVGQAQQIANVGITATDIPEIMAWLRNDEFWARKGIDLGVVQTNIDKWRAANAPKKPKDPNHLERGLARAG